jgi:hypothetical protein
MGKDIGIAGQELLLASAMAVRKLVRRQLQYL